jgi:hypothetical protein
VLVSLEEFWIDASTTLLLGKGETSLNGLRSEIPLLDKSSSTVSAGLYTADDRAFEVTAGGESSARGLPFEDLAFPPLFSGIGDLDLDCELQCTKLLLELLPDRVLDLFLPFAFLFFFRFSFFNFI